MLGVSEEGRHGVEVLLADRVELVVVAGRAVGGEPEPDPRGGGDPIVGVIREVLLLDGTALVGGHVAPVEAGGDLLVFAGSGQQVPGDLLHGEPVEGHVAIEGPDDPVAVGPHLAVVVKVQAVGVGVAGRIEPIACPVLAPLRRVHEAIHPALVGVGARVADELLNPFGPGRQAGEIEGRAASQASAVGLGIGLKPLGLEPSQNERIQPTTRPASVFHRRQRGLFGLQERPVRLPLSALEDPPLHDLLLCRSEIFVGLGRWHDLVGIGGDQALPEGALAEVTGHHGRSALGGGGEETLPGVEAQAGLAGAGIRAVAVEARIGQDRPDVVVEAHRLGGSGSGVESAPGQERGQNPGRGRDRPEDDTHGGVGWLHENLRTG